MCTVGTVSSESTPVLSSVKMGLLQHVGQTPNADEFDWKRKRSFLSIMEILDCSDIDCFLRSQVL